MPISVVGIFAMERSILTLTFDPPDDQGAIAVTWSLDGHTPVTVNLTTPFENERWSLIQRALNARQYPQYEQQSAWLFAPTPAERAALEQYDLWDAHNQRLPADLHERVGRHLGRALLHGAGVRPLLDALREAAGDIVLAFIPDADNTQHIGALPWELAFDGPQPWLLREGRVLTCTRRFVADPPDYAISDRPRVLLLTPRAGFNDGARRYEREARRHLRDALDDHVELEALGPPLTMDMLDNRLRDGPPVTLVDYYGHGLLTNGQGCLVFDDAAGGRDPVNAARLQALANPPPFWVIAACQSAQQPPGEELIANLAPALTAHPRVAAVLALQLTTRMAAATDYVTPAIYTTLARRESLQAAAAEARRRLYAAEKDSASFYLPTLYVRQRRAEPLYLTPPRMVISHPDGGVPFSPPSGGSPFTPGNVARPDRFVGRTQEIQAILNRLQNMLSVSLVGEARIGKSSLLRYLEARLPDLLREHGDYLPIYLSMDRLADQASFCREVLERLLPRMPALPGQERALRAWADTPDPSIRDLERALEWAERGGLRVVLLLDEFKHTLEHNDAFDETFLGILRSLYAHGDIALVLATRQSLIGLVRAYFANAVDEQILSTMPRAEAEALLRQPHDRPFTPAEVRIGLRAGRDHPLCLQWAGALLYESKGQPPGRFHARDGALRRWAWYTLDRTVRKKYARARRASNPRRPSRTAAPSPLNHAITKLAETLDSFGARITAVLLLLGVVALLLYALGLLSFDQLQRLLALLSGGS